jgi:isoquinoline 1-oxidoreductase subunit beta
MKRRTWLLSALGATGALVLGWGLLPPRSRLGSAQTLLPAEGQVALNGWIRVAADGQVVMAMPRSEMGQGVHTGLAMLVAEELDLPLDHVRLEQAGADRIYGNVAMLMASLPFHPLEAEAAQRPLTVRLGEWMVSKVARELGLNVTGGSSSMADAWEPVRLAAATARASLLQAAAEQWQVPVSELQVQQGVVRHASGRQAHYGALAARAAAITPVQVSLKPAAQWTLLGRPQPRSDAPAKSNGSAVFGMDVRLPGMLFASVRMCPMLGGSVARMDDQKALAQPGVLRLVPLEAVSGGTAGFAVVARSTWAAMQGAAAVEVQWQQRSTGALDTGAVLASLQAQLQPGAGHVFYEKGDAAQAEAGAAQVLEASYQAPYLAHATLEPMNCTARLNDGVLEVWAPTQVPGFAREVAARVAGLSSDKVQLHVTLLGGGFGRRLETDFVAQAVRVAMACPGQAVQLLWPREQDMGHDFYRPMHVARLRAAITPQGQVSSLRIQSAGDAISPRWLERVAPALAAPMDTPDKTTAEGLFDLPYAFASQHMAHVATHSGVPVGFWRSVGHSHNAFFSECFVDELAHATGQDPLLFRRALLAEAPRYRAVLDLAADKAGWGSPLPTGRARGLALHASFGSVVAQVVEVSLPAGQPRVHRVVCAIDCGTVVNPASVAQQMEGSVAFALSAALYGRIDIREGVVQQTQFSTYPVLRMDQMPEVQTCLVPSTRAPSGVGEPGVPPLAPALANALFVLTQKRHRSLPLLA